MSDRLLYVAMPKTACTTILSILVELIEGVERRKHALVERSDFIEGRRYVGSIRSPWSYYVSLWAFGCEGGGGIRRAIARHPVNNQVYGDPRDPTLFRRWLRLVLNDHEALRGAPGGFHGSTLATFAGLVTMRYCRFFLSPEARGHYLELPTFADLLEVDAEMGFIDDFIHQERLESDLIEVLGRCGTVLTPEQRSLIERAPHTNVSPWSGNPMEYYDDESVCLVAERDRFIIERFGYEPPGQPLRTGELRAIPSP